MILTWFCVFFCFEGISCNFTWFSEILLRFHGEINFEWFCYLWWFYVILLFRVIAHGFPLTLLGFRVLLVILCDFVAILTDFVRFCVTLCDYVFRVILLRYSGILRIFKGLAVRPRLRPWRSPCVANCSEATAPYVRTSSADDSTLMYVRTYRIICCCTYYRTYVPILQLR